MKGLRSNSAEVQGLRGGAIITRYCEWIFQHGEFRYTWDQQRGEHCIHDPIHADTYPRDNTRVGRMRLTPLFILISPTFLCYHVHLPWRADINISITDHGCKEINITYILDAWLFPYLWIYTHYHPDGSVDWDYQGPQKWPPMVLLQHFLYPG